jgi:hypothetical protein
LRVFDSNSITLFQELGLLGYTQLYDFKFFPQPSTPHIELFGAYTDPTMFAAMGRAPYSQLPPEDIALLDADLTLRFRYCELAHTILLPSLRRMSNIFGTKSHLNEDIAPARLDSLLPGIGRDWPSFIGSLSLVFQDMRVYAAQFESLIGRWEQERYDLLQPDRPSVHYIIFFIMNIEQRKDLSKKEVELIGMSSGSRIAAGGLDYVKTRAAQAADAQTMDTSTT